MAYDPEEVFRDIVVASKGSDADLTGMLEVRDRDGTGLYDQLRQLRGIQWPAPTRKSGGTTEPDWMFIGVDKAPVVRP